MLVNIALIECSNATQYYKVQHLEGIDDTVGIIVEDVGEFVDIGLLVEVDGFFEELIDGLFEEVYSYEEGGFPKRSNAFKRESCTRSLRPIASWRSARAMTIER